MYLQQSLKLVEVRGYTSVQQCTSKKYNVVQYVTSEITINTERDKGENEMMEHVTIWIVPVSHNQKDENCHSCLLLACVLTPFASDIRGHQKVLPSIF